MQSIRPLTQRLVLLWLCAFILQARAQSFERVVSGIPFTFQNEPLALPFFGGFDPFLPQFLDIDGDRDLDLFVLKPFFTARNRQWEGRLTFFENTGDAQIPRFAFHTNFYHDFSVHTWFHFIDIDADGDFDLYHDNGANGLTLQRNIGTQTRAQFTLAAPTVLDRNNQRVANEFSSTPTFTDIDGDGDFDFFSGLSLGAIAFYRNVGSAFAPLFAFETNRWQDLLIVSGGAQAKRTAVHGGNAITFHDLDRDGDQDFFYGDFFHKSIYHMRNEGNAREEKITIADSLWPVPEPLRTSGYNTPHFADLDNNGFADLFVAVGNDNRNNFLFYKNAEGTGLRFSTSNFFSQIDVGGNCSPALADLDADHDLDLTLGALTGELLFFENTGTSSAPAFRESPDKFPNLNFNGYLLAPAFVDIDADRDFDLFVGNYTGTTLFYENLGTPQAPRFVLQATAYEGIRVGLSSSPHFADLDHDNDYDLAVGEIANGTVTFYENVGNASTPRLLFKSQFLPEAGTTDSKPFLHDWNRDGSVDLFIGQRNGRVLYYQGISAQFSDTFKLAHSEFGVMRVGASSAIALGDLNNDGAVDFFIGEEAGGLNYYVNRTNTTVHQTSPPPSAFTLRAYPNPVQNVLHIQLRTIPSNALPAPHAVIFNVLGERVASFTLQKHNAGEWQSEWRVATMQINTGVYFLRVQTGQHNFTQKILLLE